MSRSHREGVLYGGCSQGGIDGILEGCLYSFAGAENKIAQVQAEDVTEARRLDRQSGVTSRDQ